MRALIVDDSRAIRAVMARTLRQLGYEVTEAGNGREALSRLEETAPFDLALVDWNMPVMDGLTFIQAVRADHRYDDLRLMMVTTENESARVISALEAGANEYVMKPFTEQVLVEKLALLGMPMV